MRLILAEKPSVSAEIAYCAGASDKISEVKAPPHEDRLRLCTSYACINSAILPNSSLKYVSIPSSSLCNLAKFLTAHLMHNLRAVLPKYFYRQGNGYIVANALGHLVGIGIPEDYGYTKWSLDELPIIPDHKLFALKGHKGYIEFLRKLFNRNDVTEIINACDAGREGECIFRYIYNYFGCTKPVKRLWINSLTDDAIRNGMSNLIDSAALDNMFTAGFARARSDWIFGINFSRYYSLKTNQHHRCGRVKNAVLNIIAEREKQINDFVKKPYYKVVLENGAECERTFDTEEEAEAIKTKCEGKSAVVVFVKAEKKTENRPLLHSLTSLQREANEICSMTAADTLNAAQSLYEKKLLTYPRTDSNFISEDMKPLAESVVKCLAGYDKKRTDKLILQGLNFDKRVVNNAKITDHHAIIPTNQIGKFRETKLSENEKKIAELVINRFLSALDKPYICLETKYEFEVEGEIFRLTTKKPVSLGWREYSFKKQPVPDYAENDSFIIGNVNIRDCETKSPAHFTEASLLAVMENIDRVIEDKELKDCVKKRGLGTPATRAEIIEGLISAKYILRKKKQIYITDFGKNFIRILPDNIKSAELTARREQMLSEIEQGKCKEEEFMNEIIQSVSDVIENDNAVVDTAAEKTISVQPDQIGKCPWCGSPIREGKKAFYCTNGEDCDFFIYKHDKRIGRNYKAAEIGELLESGRVTLRNCTSSKGNKYAAVFELDDSGEYVNLKFVEFVKTKKTVH